MKDFNRREFLKQGLFATGAIFFSFNPLEKLFGQSTQKAAPDAANNQTDKSVLQKKAKAYFFQKEYQKAEQSYKELIFLFPDYIAAYDGLAKTFYAQNKSLAAAEAYRQDRKSTRLNSSH